jgi:hypothetical protein
MQSVDSSQLRRPSSRIWQVTILIMAIIIVALLGACGYLLSYQRTSLLGSGNDKQEVTAIIKELSQRISLPSEQAVLAKVLDRHKLNDTQLAAEAQNGDALLIYPKAKRVFLYRPSTHKLVDIFRVQDTTGTVSGANTKAGA